MNKRSLVSITDYSKEDILEVLKIASEFEKNPNRNLRWLLPCFSSHLLVRD